MLLKIGNQSFTLAQNLAGATNTSTIKIYNTDAEYTNTGPSDIRFFYQHFFRDPDDVKFEFMPIGTCDEGMDPDTKRHVQPFICYGITGSRTGTIP